MKEKREWGSFISAILRTLEEYGPMTRSEIEKHLNADKSEFGGVIGKLTKPGKKVPQRIHISGYVYDQEGARYYPRAIYAFGPGENKPKPKPNAKSTKARYEKMVIDRVRNASVFNLGLRRDDVRRMKKNVQTPAVHMGQGS